MRVPQLLDIPRLIICSECIRRYGSKTTQCRVYHNLALLRRLLEASSKHHMNRALPRQAAVAFERRTNRSVQQNQRRTRPRTAPPCTRLHHSCQKAAQRIRTLTASVEQATPTNTASVTGHGYHRRPTEGKKKEWQSQAMQGAAVNSTAVVLS